MANFCIEGRHVGKAYPPLVIAEIGINHEGSIEKARRMIDDAAKAGCECVKFQCHILEDEMIPNEVVPGNAIETIWEIITRCALTREEEKELFHYTKKKGMIFLSTPFSRKAADRLAGIGVGCFKIGSGECNNFPLIEHIASYKKPVILSTGMNSIKSIVQAVGILQNHNIDLALLHCTSIYPTPYNKIRLGALDELRSVFPDLPVGLSDHSMSNLPCLAAVAKGANIIERHFTSDDSWPGPDISISMNPEVLKELIQGSHIIYQCLGGKKEVLEEEQATIDFAYSSVVSIKSIKEGDTFCHENTWVKRPGKGGIPARELHTIIGKKARCDIQNNVQIRRSWID